jgi:hypothetical protein
MAVLGLVGLAAFAIYRWKQRRRVRRLEGCVRDYLAGRYGQVPRPLYVNCSDDALWPVLVSFDDPRTGSRHGLQFACWGPPPGISLLSETEEPRAKARGGRWPPAEKGGGLCRAPNKRLLTLLPQPRPGRRAPC